MEKAPKGKAVIWVRWILVIPAGLLAGVGIWLISLLLVGAAPNLEVFIQLTTALLRPFSVVYFGTLMAPGHRLPASIALAATWSVISIGQVVDGTTMTTAVSLIVIVGAICGVLAIRFLPQRRTSPETLG